MSLDEVIARACAAVDAASLGPTFSRQGRFVHHPFFLPADLVATLAAEFDAMRDAVHRVHVPTRKGGAVSYETIRRRAPTLAALYESGPLLRWFGAVAGETLRPCPERDLHRCAVYVYTEEGDHIASHYDTSFYRGRRYTALLGLRDQSTSRLVCRLRTARGVREERVATSPGSLVFFDGDAVLHRVTPLGAGEARMVVAMEFVTDPTMRWPQRVVSDLKDALGYFGVKAVFGRR